MSPVIAVVYIPNGASKAIRTAPGQWLKFIGGKAEVKHEMHMPTVLALPDAHVQVSHDWREWLPVWVARVPDAEHRLRARVEILGMENAESSEDWLPIDRVSFGTHPEGHQCGFCQNARRRAVAARMATMELTPA